MTSFLSKYLLTIATEFQTGMFIVSSAVSITESAAVSQGSPFLKKYSSFSGFKRIYHHLNTQNALKDWEFCEGLPQTDYS